MLRYKEGIQVKDGVCFFSIFILSSEFLIFVMKMKKILYIKLLNMVKNNYIFVLFIKMCYYLFL